MTRRMLGGLGVVPFLVAALLPASSSWAGEQARGPAFDCTKASGTVAFRLDCNSAKGTWSAEAGPDRSSGRFEFGPLVTTRALCPPPSLDERIGREAQFVRSFLAKASYVRLSFDGKRYVERERMPADEAPEGKSYLAGELTFEKGIPLEPRK